MKEITNDADRLRQIALGSGESATGAGVTTPSAPIESLSKVRKRLKRGATERKERMNEPLPEGMGTDETVRAGMPAFLRADAREEGSTSESRATVAAPAVPARLVNAEIEWVIPTPDNPRRKIDLKSPGMVELIASVRQHGILQPLVGRPHPVWEAESGRIDLRAGHRRHAAAVAAGLTHVPVMVREMTDREAMEVTVLENHQREDLTPMEEARGVKKLLETGHDADEIAAAMSKFRMKGGESVPDRGWVLRRAKLGDLTKRWSDWAEERTVSAEHLELIARYDHKMQGELFELFARQTWNEAQYFTRPGSLKELKLKIGELMRRLSLAPWKLDDALLLPKAGACAVCPQRSGCQADLFDEHESKGDQCLNVTCWNDKREAWVKRRDAELRAEHKNLQRICGEGGMTHDSKALQSWDYKVVKKGAAGALPALVVDGSGLGTVKWVSLKSGSGVAAREVKKAVTAAAKQAVASHDPEASAKLLKEKQAMHELRRWAQVAKELERHLKESELPNAAEYRTAEGLVRLVAVFGTEGTPYLSDRGKYYAQLGKLGSADALEKTWAAVKPKIEQTLVVFTVQSIGKEHHEAMKGVAMLLGLKIEELKKAADQAIPEPKSWEQLRRLAEAPPAAKAPKTQAPSSKTAKGTPAAKAPSTQAPSSKAAKKSAAPAKPAGKGRAAKKGGVEGFFTGRSEGEEE